MFGKNPQNDEQLDRLGEVVLRAAAAYEQEMKHPRLPHFCSPAFAPGLLKGGVKNRPAGNPCR